MRRDFIGMLVMARHQQGGAAAHTHARGNAVDAAQLVFIGVVLSRHFGHAHVGGGGPQCPAGQLLIPGVGQVLAEARGALPGQQQRGRERGNHQRPVERRVEGAEIFQRDAGQPGDRAGVHVARDAHLVEIRVVGDIGQRGIEGGRVAHDVLEGLQLGHVHAGFLRHGQFGKAGATAGGLVAADRLLHIAFAPVVGGQCQVPVTEHVVEALQVVERGTRGLHHVAPVVQEQVLVQLVLLAGGRHELPHAGCLGTADGERVERAFHVRQQRDLGRHVAAFQCLDHVVDVLVGAADQALDGRRVARIPGLAVAHGGIVEIRHGKALAQAIPDVVRVVEAEAGTATIEVRDAQAGTGGRGLAGGGTACQQDQHEGGAQVSECRHEQSVSGNPMQPGRKSESVFPFPQGCQGVHRAGTGGTLCLRGLL